MRPRATSLIIAAIAIGMLYMPYVNAGDGQQRKCGSMKWQDKDHGDNNPSSKKFYQMAYHASLCDLAKCVDNSECADHDKVNIDKFKQAPAYTQATDKQQKELDEYMKDGHGADGLVGYEILYAISE
mgnify:CR=1 FL=1